MYELYAYLSNSIDSLFDLYRQLELSMCHEISVTGDTLGTSLAGIGGILQKIDAMRASELRNLLIQDLHVSQETIGKILDRNELKDMARSMITIHTMEDCRASLFRVGVITPMIVTFTIILLLTFSKQCRKNKTNIMWISSFFLNEDRFWKKLLLARICSKQWATIFGLVAIFTSLVGEVIIVWINISVILGWILPRHSAFRQWLFFGVSFPVNASMMKSMIMGTANTNMSNTEITNWSVDLGSLMTSTIFRWICSKLDDFAAHSLISFKKYESFAQNQEGQSTPNAKLF